MIHLYYPEEKRPIGCFNTDDTAMYRLLLKLLQQNRKLDFRRVYADIMELFGGNLTAFVEGREAMPDLTILSNETFTLERMQKLEEELDIRIFDRTNRSVTPTTAGEKIIRQAENALMEIERIGEIVSEDKRICRRKVRPVGRSHDSAIYTAEVHQTL